MSVFKLFPFIGLVSSLWACSSFHAQQEKIDPAEAEVLFSPNVVGGTILSAWKLASVVTDGGTDILARVEEVETGRSIVLWLVAKGEKSPYYAQTDNFNISYAFSAAPYALLEKEKQVLDVLIETVRRNDVGRLRLQEKIHPEIFAPAHVASAGGKPRLHTYAVAGGMWLALVVLWVHFRLVRRQSRLPKWFVMLPPLFLLAVAGAAKLPVLLNNDWSSVVADEARVGLAANAMLRTHVPLLSYGDPAQTAATAYFVLPFAALLGDPVYTLRAANWFYSLAGVFLTFAVASRIGGWTSGLLAGGSMVAFPYFVSYSATWEYTLMPAAVALALLLLVRYVETRRPRWLMLTGLSAGIGVSIIPTFAFFLAGLSLAGIVRLLWERHTVQPKWIIGAVASLVVGLLPALLYARSVPGLYWAGLSAHAPVLGSWGDNVRMLVWTLREYLPVISGAAAGLILALVCFKPLRDPTTLFLLLAFLPTFAGLSVMSWTVPHAYRFLVVLPILCVLCAIICSRIFGRIFPSQHPFEALSLVLVPLLFWAGDASAHAVATRARMDPGPHQAAIELLKDVDPYRTIHVPHFVKYVHYLLRAGRDFPPLKPCDVVPLRGYQEGECGAWLSLGVEGLLQEDATCAKGGSEGTPCRTWTNEILSGSTTDFFFLIQPGDDFPPGSPGGAYQSLVRTLRSLDLPFDETEVDTVVAQYKLVSLRPSDKLGE